MGVTIIAFAGKIPDTLGPDYNGSGLVRSGKVWRITHTCPWCGGQNKLGFAEAHEVNGEWRWTIAQPCLECCYDLARDTESDSLADDETRAQAHEAGMQVWHVATAYKARLEVPHGWTLWDYDREIVRKGGRL